MPPLSALLLPRLAAIKPFPLKPLKPLSKPYSKPYSAAAVDETNPDEVVQVEGNMQQCIGALRGVATLLRGWQIRRQVGARRHVCGRRAGVLLLPRGRPARRGGSPLQLPPRSCNCNS